jgi:hypothetical protein
LLLRLVARDEMLQGLGRDRTDPARHDLAPAIDEKRSRQARDLAEQLAGRRPPDQDRVRQKLILDERPQALDANLFHVDAQHDRPSGRVAVVKNLKFRQFFQAGWTPSRPIIHDNPFAAVIRQPMVLTGQVGQPEIGRSRRCDAARQAQQRQGDANTAGRPLSPYTVTQRDLLARFPTLGCYKSGGVR